jgi:hypothetical protein
MVVLDGPYTRTRSIKGCVLVEITPRTLTCSKGQACFGLRWHVLTGCGSTAGLAAHAWGQLATARSLGKHEG